MWLEADLFTPSRHCTDLGTAEARNIVRAAPRELKTGNYIIAMNEGINQSRFDDIVEEVISTGSTICSKVIGDFAKIIWANLIEETLRKVKKAQTFNNGSFWLNFLLI